MSQMFGLKYPDVHSSMRRTWKPRPRGRCEKGEGRNVACPVGRCAPLVCALPFLDLTARARFRRSTSHLDLVPEQHSKISAIYIIIFTLDQSR